MSTKGIKIISMKMVNHSREVKVKKGKILILSFVIDITITHTTISIYRVMHFFVNFTNFNCRFYSFFFVTFIYFYCRFYSFFLSLLFISIIKCIYFFNRLCVYKFICMVLIIKIKGSIK
ncbi:hypothetical protein H311_00890 [Anncaliia algerae PRA109]|nr:hypothetical protein H311_00890 [Anncaliia algerae PRA109]